ncbi:MAG: enoyl-CoA hydratase/isomerase family protein [Bacteroidota bacterium]
MTDQHIICSRKGGIGEIILNRPPANSYFEELLEELAQQIDILSQSEDVKVIAIKSNSEKFFCAGADIKIFAGNTSAQNKAMVVAARQVTSAITNSDKIIVAVINGHTLGGGLELAMACDIRLASEGDYLIGLPEVKLGLMPGNGGTLRLIDLIGMSRAKEMLLTGCNLTPQQSFDSGLFNRLYRKEEFEKEVGQYLSELAQGPKHALAAIKAFVSKSRGMTEEAALSLETKLVDQLYDTTDAIEGFKAFVEKRPPKFE